MQYLPSVLPISVLIPSYHCSSERLERSYQPIERLQWHFASGVILLSIVCKVN